MAGTTLSEAGVLVALGTGFSRSIASDEVPRGRPHPDMIDALREKLGVTEPGRVAKIGDTPSDLLQGTAACCGWVIGVTRGSHSEQELAVHPHTCLIPTVAVLPALLGL